MRSVFVAALLGVLCLGQPVQPVVAQEFTARARVLVDDTGVDDTRAGLNLRLGLSQGVPYRIFALDDPARLVMDFREVDWQGLPEAIYEADGLTGVRFGRYRPGWSRLIVDLAAPLALDSADMQIDEDTGQAQLNVVLRRVDGDDFAARAGAPVDPDWGLPAAAQVQEAHRRQTGSGPLTVVIDPGHGGIDPGARRGDSEEKTLMLMFGRELRDALLRTGQVRVVMTRDADVFVPLETRVTIAHEARADLFISLHADALDGGGARGATLYTLSDEASDAASEKLAERHDRADLLAGVDLSGQDDLVAHVLMDLARTETEPRAVRAADALEISLREAGGPLNSRPRRKAGFSVLKAADIPSVLLEVGFLSSDRDRENLNNPAWRARTVTAIQRAILAWAIADAAEGQLIRQ